MNTKFQIGIIFLALLPIGCGRSAPLAQEDQPGNKIVDTESASTESDGIESSASETDLVDSDDTETEDLDPNRIIYKTPQECFSAWQRASEANDLAATFGCMAQWDRNQRVGWLAYYLDREILYARPNADQAKALLEKYDIKPGNVMSYVHLAPQLALEDLAKLVTEIGGKINHPSEFFVEASKLVTVTVLQGQSPPEEMTLTKIDIQGTTATGAVKLAGSKTNDPIYFVRESGSWLVSSRR